MLLIFKKARLYNQVNGSHCGLKSKGQRPHKNKGGNNMVLPQFEYMTPKSVEETCRLLKELGPEARVMAGATDLIPPMRDHAVKPEPKYLLDIKGIPGLDELTYDEESGLKIGALTKLRTIETSELVKKVNPAVAHAAKVIASTQIRYKGTLVGNICNASPSMDSAPNLLAQDAVILIQGVDGKREVPAKDFFTGVKRTCLQSGEMVTGVVIPPLGKNDRAVYIKHAVRKAMDLAIIGVAVKLTVKDGVCSDAKIALGAVATTPILAPKAAEVLIGQKLTDEVIEKCGQAAMDSCSPISDIRASKEYRKAMIGVFTKRAVKACLEA